MEGTHERRERARLPLRCRVLFYRDSSNAIAEAVTQNISSVGFYCLSPIGLSLGESLTCLVKMPSHNAANDEIFELECLIRVVRVEKTNEEWSFGIGCQIQNYHVRTAIPAEPLDTVLSDSVSRQPKD